MGFFDKAKGKLGVVNKGASLNMQRYWKSLPEWKKNQLRRVLPDTDRDGVPDKFDCQPLNSRKQDSYSDAEVLRGLEESRGDYNPDDYRKSGRYTHGYAVKDDRTLRGAAEMAQDPDLERNYRASEKINETGIKPALIWAGKRRWPPGYHGDE